MCIMPMSLAATMRNASFRYRWDQLTESLGKYDKIIDRRYDKSADWSIETKRVFVAYQQARADDHIAKRRLRPLVGDISLHDGHLAGNGVETHQRGRHWSS